MPAGLCMIGPMESQGSVRAARALLVSLALFLPFEVPLFRLGPLEITTVELALYATLAAWGLALALGVFHGRPPWAAGLASLGRDPMARAVVLWCAATFVSAACAPTHRGAALKFALRSLSGVLVFFAARSLARPPDVARRALVALCIGGVVSAATAAVEWLVPGSTPLWSVFHEARFETLGLMRASGVFGYPTIGAMFWEAVAPLVIAAPLVAEKIPRPRGAAVAMLASALLIGAILASGTRSGLAGVTVACGALLWFGWPAGAWMRVLSTWALVLVATSLLVLRAQGSGSPLGERVQWWHDDRWLRVEYSVDSAPRVVRVGELFAVPVTLRNTGTLSWPHAGDHPTHLAYHWERRGVPEQHAENAAPPTLAVFEGRRTALSEDVAPGVMLRVVGMVQSPPQEGAYSLRWDLVQEGVSWFSEQGNPMPEQQIEVSVADDSGSVAVEDEPRPDSVAPPPPRMALWRAAGVLWREHPLLGIGPDNFRRSYEAILSPSPTGQPYTDERIHANSLYFETLADLGVVGIAALAALGLALLGLLREHVSAGRLAGLACGVAAGTFFVHGALDYFLEFTPLFGLFWLLLGLTAASEPERAPRR
jgi:hypothetical protein